MVFEIAERTCPGHCCETIYQPFDPDRLVEMADTLMDGQQVAEMLVPTGEISGSSHHYKCKNWDPDTRLCKIYDDRPTMCRDYPYGNPCPHCGMVDGISAQERLMKQQARRDAFSHPDSIAAISEVLERLEAQITPRGPVEDEQWYGWIPFPLDQFIEGMRICRQQLGPGWHRFLDIGSGIGTKLALADALGFESFGIERWKPYVDVSDRCFPHCPVIVSEANYPNEYDRFDVVFLYGCATSSAEHERLNRVITGQMKSGALFFAPKPPLPVWLEHVDGPIWRIPS